MAALTDRQLLAVHLLLSGGIVTATAKVVGLTRQTLHNWRRQPLFRREMATQRHDHQAAFRDLENERETRTINQ